MLVSKELLHFLHSQLLPALGRVGHYDYGTNVPEQIGDRYQVRCERLSYLQSVVAIMRWYRYRTVSTLVELTVCGWLRRGICNRQLTTKQLHHGPSIPYPSCFPRTGNSGGYCSGAAVPSNGQREAEESSLGSTGNCTRTIPPPHGRSKDARHLRCPKSGHWFDDNSGPEA